MRRMTENLSPADRRFYWKFVGSLFGFYGAVMIIMVGVFFFPWCESGVPSRTT